MPVPQSKPATFSQGTGSPDLSLEAISIQGPLKGWEQGTPWVLLVAQ